jgi:hypothetical protein
MPGEKRPWTRKSQKSRNWQLKDLSTQLFRTVPEQLPLNNDNELREVQQALPGVFESSVTVLDSYRDPSLSVLQGGNSGFVKIRI